MILEFSNLKEIEEEKSKIELSNTKLRKQKELEYFLTIKRNIIDLFLVHNDLLTDGKKLPKSNSEPNLSKIKKHSKNNISNKKKNRIKYKNLNIKEEETKICDESKNNKIKNNLLKNNIECNIYFNNNSENNENIEKFQHERNSYQLHNKENLNLEKISNKDELNINKNYSENDIKNINNQIFNSKYDINNDFNNNNNYNNIENSQNLNINNNLINSPLNALEDNSSLNSAKNENSLKNPKNNNQRSSFYSSSSFGKNFVLKNKACKSTKNNENNFYKINNNSDDVNPIMAYYMGNNLGNFYLVTDKKSQEELDGYNYMNFFPMNEKKMKNKDKDIMSCIYIDNKVQKYQNEKSKNINNENKKIDEQSDDIFNFNGFNDHNKNMYGETNEEEKIEFENLNLGNNDNDIKDNNINNFENNIINNKNYINSDNNDNSISNNFVYNNDNNRTLKNNNNIINNKISLDNNHFSNINNNNNLPIEEKIENINNIPIDNNNFMNININNNLSVEDNKNIFNNIPIQNNNLLKINNNNLSFEDNKNNLSKNQIENNNFLNIHINNDLTKEENINNINNLSLKNFDLDNNNFKFSLNKKNENLNLMNNNIDNDLIKKLNINEDNNIKLPLNFSNTTFNFNDPNLKEFKLNQEILNEISNLNKNMTMNQKYFQPQDYNQPPDNYYNPTNKQFNNFDININDINLDNFNINDLNLNNINFTNNDFNINNFTENLNVINMLPLNKSFYDYTDDELIQYSIPLIKDQSGCRFLQDKIKANQYFANEKLFPQIKFNIKELGCDPFGNYFLQVLIEVLNYDNLKLLLDLIKNEFTSICICPHGTRVIQKIIEKISQIPDLLTIFINNLNKKDLGIICESAYGNHIMQKFLTTIHNPECTKFIYDYVFENFMEISKTKHGVCVIQKCVSEGDQNQRKKIFDLILNNFDILIKDQFANYLIQYILINTNTKEKFMEIMPLINRIEINLIDYCKSKFSANVIEKCFENNENYIREHILEYLLKHYKDNIIEILLDQYGIYIIQKALKLNNVYKKKLCDIINQKQNELKNININDFKYRGILKIINTNKELGMIFSKTKENNNNSHNNKSNSYNNDVENRNNIRGKNKRGRKHYRGNNGKY